MEVPYFAQDNPGKSVIMLGNEAIARGILEAGTIIGAGYPGTPSSEILKTLAIMENYFPHLKLEWSTNEKVALEIAIAGSMSKVRSVACMKHVGVNVAADAFMTIAYAGARGGLVLVSADDPNLYSSQNEQDNRFYGLHGLVPVFEPSTPQEAKDMIKYAFKFSEKYETIVLFRTTTRLNHGRGNVLLGEIEEPQKEFGFDWDRERWVCVPSHSRVNREKLLNRMERISKDVNESELNSLIISRKSINGTKYGFLSAGIPYAHLKDALSYLEIEDKVSILKLGIEYPLPRKRIIDLLHSVDKLLIVEELEPIFETMVKKIAFEEGFGDKIEIHGKDILPQKFEFPAELIIEKVSEFLNIEYEQMEIPENDLNLPPRLPMLCPGCSHRATFYAINQVEKKLKKQFINSSDIGCYTLGVYKPLAAIDTQICMGGSIGMANGFSKLYGKEQPLLAILGDSTFFHTGVPGLINAVYNQNDMLIIILDNRSTSMTGFQDNPGTGMKIGEEPGTRVILEDLVKGCGVPEKNIWVEDSNNINKMIEKLQEAIEANGVRVFISRHICSLLEMSEFKAQNISPPTYKIDSEKCTGCQICINQFGCPAITFDEELKKAKIDQSLCRGCGVCTYVCPQEAIYEEEL